ncbi:MAG: amidohydrolase [Candidatus Bathyarchaeia archaeon]
MKAIVGATILTPEQTIPKGVIIFDEGKILEVGKDLKIPEKAEIVEAEGKYISPGLVDGHSHIGMTTEGLDWEYGDANDFYSPLTPHLRAIDAVNLFDPGFKDALEGGVTTVYTGPGSANVIGGIGVILKTFGKTPEEMIVNDFASVKMATGAKRKREMKSKLPYPTTKMGTIALLRSMLQNAKRYMEGKLKTEKIVGEEEIAYQALSRVLRREIPARIHTSLDPDEILAVINIAKEFNIKVTIDHGFGSQIVAEKLAEANIPVISGPLMIARLSQMYKYVSDEIPAILSSKGVKTSIMTDHPVIAEKYLRISAIVAVINGMNRKEALKAITINPAEAIGIGDKVGSLEPGKDADIVVFSDDPLKVKSKVEMVFLKGEKVYEAI